MTISIGLEALATTAKARQFCRDVTALAAKYELSFFVVTEGASAIRNKNCPAVRNAREAHMEWERKQGISSTHDWSKEKKGSKK